MTPLTAWEKNLSEAAQGTAWPQARHYCWECAEEVGSCSSSSDLSRAYGNTRSPSFPVGFCFLFFPGKSDDFSTPKQPTKSQDPLSLDSKAFIIFERVRKLCIPCNLLSSHFLPLVEGIHQLIIQMRCSEGWKALGVCETLQVVSWYSQYSLFRR